MRQVGLLMYDDRNSATFQILLVAYSFVCRQQNIETGLLGIGDERPV